MTNWPQRLMPITRYELTVLTMMVSGFRLKEIAKLFGKSYHSTNHQLKSARRKLRLSKGLQLRTDLISLEPFIEHEWDRLRRGSQRPQQIILMIISDK